MGEDADTLAFCGLEELARRGHVTRWVEELGDELTAVCVGEEVRVYSSFCPHAGGEIVCDARRSELRCRWHAARFDAVSGRAISPPALPALAAYVVSIADGTVRVRRA